MTEQAHTPGPWTWNNSPYEDGVPFISFRAGTNPHTEDLSRGFYFTAIISEENARLIAAAPDMLAALRAAHSQLLAADTFFNCGREIKQVLAAIAKATGAQS